MHNNDGLGIDLIKLTRKVCKKLDKIENDHVLTEEKNKLEEDITEIQEQIEVIADTIKLMSEEFESIAEQSEQSTNMLKEVMFEEMREFEILQAKLKKNAE